VGVHGVEQKLAIDAGELFRSEPASERTKILVQLVAGQKPALIVQLLGSLLKLLLDRWL
jgi:hypothetical protein